MDACHLPPLPRQYHGLLEVTIPRRSPTQALAHGFLKLTLRVESVTQQHCGCRWLTPGPPVLCLPSPRRGQQSPRSGNVTEAQAQPPAEKASLQRLNFHLKTSMRDRVHCPHFMGE